MHISRLKPFVHLHAVLNDLFGGQQAGYCLSKDECFFLMNEVDLLQHFLVGTGRLNHNIAWMAWESFILTSLTL